jgi:hypothetical protein
MGEAYSMRSMRWGRLYIYIRSVLEGNVGREVPLDRRSLKGNIKINSKERSVKTLKMEAVYLPETSKFLRTTRHFNS